MVLNPQSSSWQETVGPILPVSAGNDGRVGALGVGQREQPLGLVDGRPGGSIGQGVGWQIRDVWSTDTLNPDLRGSIPALKGIRYSRACATSLLLIFKVRRARENQEGGSYHVTQLGRCASKDEDHPGARGAATRLELVACQAGLADLEVGNTGVDGDFDRGLDRSRGDKGGTERDDGEDLHFGKFSGDL